MNVRDLITLLEDLDQFAEVRIASQPHWPFENAIDEVVEVGPGRIIHKADFDEMSEEEQERTMAAADEGMITLLDEGEDEPETVVYIGEGSQIGYLPTAAARELGWK